MDLITDLKARALIVGNAPPGPYRIDLQRSVQGWQDFERTGDEGAFAHNPDAVKSLQRQLATLGYTTLPGNSSGVAIDGVMGTGTRAGIQRFQGEHGLPVGAFDPRTARTIQQQVEGKLARMSPEEVTFQGWNLDGSLDGRSFLPNHFRPQLEAAAKGAQVPPEKFYALIRTESAGGTKNFPRLENGVYRGIDTLCSHLAEQRTELVRLDPGRDAARIDTLYHRAQGHGMGGLLDQMTHGNRTPAGKLAAMDTLAHASPAQRRELATSWGHVQILGYQTLDPRWQQASGRSAAQLMDAIQSPDPRIQLETAGSFIAHGSDSRGRSGGVAEALRSGSNEAIALAHNGGAWRQYNPDYPKKLARAEQEYAPLNLPAVRAIPRQRSYAQARSRVLERESPAIHLPEATSVPSSFHQL